MTGEEIFILCCAILAVVFMVIVVVQSIPEHKRTTLRLIRNFIILLAIVAAFILSGIYIVVKMNEPEGIENIETVH